MDGPQMLVERLQRATNDHDVDAVVACFAEDYENETPLHVKNWLAAVKDNKDPSSPIELGHKVITAAHLANMSYRTGKKIVWDAEKQQVVKS